MTKNQQQLKYCLLKEEMETLKVKATRNTPGSGFTIEKLSGEELNRFIDSVLYSKAASFGKNAKDLIKALEGCRAKIREKQRIKRSPHEIFAYVLKDEKKEFAGLTAIEVDPDEEEYIYWIVLREDIEGRGLGTWLAQQTIIDMQRRSVHSVYTFAVTDRSEKMFKTLGFTGPDHQLRRKIATQTA